MTTSTTTDASPAGRLRGLLAEGVLLRAPGVFDGLSGHLVRRAGFSAAYFTGAGVAASGFGLPDIGLVTAAEMVERLRVVVRACGLPVIADADTGYGNPMHVVRTVRDYEDAGAAAIQLEDQAFPKRCGHLADKELVEVDEFVPKLRAALEHRRQDTLIIARTDAREPAGIDEAIRRARRYAAEGADAIFVEAPTSREEIERVSSEVGQGHTVPLLFNVVPGGRSPEIDDAELIRLGYRIAIYPGAALGPAAIGMAKALAEMNDADLGEMFGPAGLFDAVGMSEWTALAEQYR
jgi:2-methylisocitrate lyase-like PEP mutase family enzyme